MNMSKALEKKLTLVAEMVGERTGLSVFKKDTILDGLLKEISEESADNLTKKFLLGLQKSCKPTRQKTSKNPQAIE